MNIKGYFDDDVRTALVYFAIGIVMGYVSFAINMSLASLAIAIIAYAAASFATKRTLREKKEKKWWASSLFIFALSWMISWTIFYNI
jgi:hypothetical protein